MEYNPSVLKRLHATFMVVAWLFFNSLGTSLARYFQNTWTNKQYFGVSRWMFFHRAYMGCCWTLTCAAIIFIFIDLEEFKAHAHAIVGLITFALCFLQPILGMATPSQTKARTTIKLLHRVFGNLAYILAVTNMFLGVGLEEAKISNAMYGLLGGTLAIHILAHVMFNILEYLARERSSELSPNKDAPFSRWRKTTLMVQMIALYAFTIANVVFVWRG
ncbi:hypothetical protein AND_007634 [Anopheles darlingi]|uniref:ascorbate ferrireductase (transmembrane) n=1 Tax=Anopheles darlingi TaxID=43151 RepID=W5JD35_ANODA|nr:putative ferric-chelate reductase 1 homolog isoform X2 [Anopheles darlingi]ETN60734.1 hypothetical protein AND_007634 [Anopheles darlingi]